MKVSEKIITLFFLFISAASAAQVQGGMMAVHTVFHHKTINSHASIVDTAETPDEHREESVGRKHPVTH